MNLGLESGKKEKSNVALVGVVGAQVAEDSGTDVGREAAREHWLFDVPDLWAH